MAENQASEVLVALTRGAGALQRQLEDQLRAAIRSGRLAEAERLPSSRALAADLGVSRGVVSDAYAQLAAEGWLVIRDRAAPRAAAAGEARAGAGTPRAGVSWGGAGSPPRPGATGAGSPPRAAAGAASPPLPAVRYDLRPGRPDLARFPRADWTRSLAAAVREAGDADFDYPPIAGADRLRRVLAAYRGRVRGTVATADDVIVTAGAGQAFVAVAEVLRPARIAVEDPGHAGIRELLEARGLEPVAVPVDEAGLVVSALPADVRAVLTTPAHQFPTGAVMGPGRRAELLAWADRHSALIVEDDYDAEYRYDRAPIGALQGLRPDLVVHVGSVSKTLAPALRLGWLLAPPAYREALIEARGTFDHGLPALEQLALADFIERGAYDRHLRRSGRAYRRRRDALIEALATALPSATVTGAAAGLHIAVHVPERVEACRARGLLVDGLTPHRVAPGPPGLLISFAALPDASAGHVAQLIASAL